MRVCMGGEFSVEDKRRHRREDADRDRLHAFGEIKTMYLDINSTDSDLIELVGKLIKEVRPYD